MPFKIVKTFRKDKTTELSICPSEWEKHGILRWPIKKSKKLVRIEDSVPNPDWTIEKCKVKRKNIPTYDEAEGALKEMLECSTTEQEDGAEVVVPATALEREIQDFNKIAKQVNICTIPI